MENTGKIQAISKGWVLLSAAFALGLPGAFAAETPGAGVEKKAEKECTCDHGKEHPADCQCDACDCSKGGECSHGKCASGHKHGAPKKVKAKKAATKPAEQP